MKYKLAAFQIRYPLILPVITLSLGQYLQSVFSIFWIFISCMLLLLILAGRSRKSVLVACLLVGALSYLNSNPPSHKYSFEEGVPYFVKVNESPRRKRVGEVSFVFELLHIKEGPNFTFTYSGQKLACRGKDLPWENASVLGEGDYAFIEASFRKLQFSYNPFSYEQKQLRRGISHECTITFASKPVGRQSFIKKARMDLANSVKTVLGEGEKAGLFLSMALGVEDAITDQTERAFKYTGMAHLLVVSGYQISIVYFSASAIFCFIFVRLPNLYLFIPIRQYASLCGFAVSFSYALLVGLDASVLRALIATIIFVICGLLDRQKDYTNSLLVSLLLLQMIFPLSIFEPGVQLTYAALLGMSLAGESKDLRSWILSSVLASLTTSFVSFCWFGNFSLLGILLNPLFASLISFVSCNIGFAAVILFICGLDPQGVILSAVATCLVYFSDLIGYLSYAEFPHFL